MQRTNSCDFDIRTGVNNITTGVYKGFPNHLLQICCVYKQTLVLSWRAYAAAAATATL